MAIDTSKVCILVSTYDGYEPCWQPFWHGLEKYWPDCPFHVVFTTNFLDAPGRASHHKTGKDLGWQYRVEAALSDLQPEYFLYCQEDYWITSPVETGVILQYLEIMADGEADYIRLAPLPGPDSSFSQDDRLGVIATEAPYRVSTQFSLWRTETFLDLLHEGDTPWSFEREGTSRSQGYGERFLSVNARKNGIQYVFTAVVRGEWTPEAREYAKRENISVQWDGLPSKATWRKIHDRTRVVAHRMRKRLGAMSHSRTTLSVDADR